MIYFFFYCFTDELLLRYGSLKKFMEYYPNETEERILKALNLMRSNSDQFKSHVLELLALQDLTMGEIEKFETLIKASASEMELPGEKALIKNKCTELIELVKTTQFAFLRLFCIVMPEEALSGDLLLKANEQKLFLTESAVKEELSKLKADSKGCYSEMRSKVEKFNQEHINYLFDEIEKLINNLPLDLAKDNGVSFGLTLYGLSKIRETYVV